MSRSSFNNILIKVVVVVVAVFIVLVAVVIVYVAVVIAVIQYGSIISISELSQSHLLIVKAESIHIMIFMSNMSSPGFFEQSVASRRINRDPTILWD